MPPAVGKDEATCPMATATTRAKMLPTTQMTPMAAPPPALSAAGKAVRPPATMQMMAKEMAKFWNAPMRRDSSCAYPISWRTFTSSLRRVSGQS